LVVIYRLRKNGITNSTIPTLKIGFGNVKCIIHSKGSEGNIDGTDVSSQYSDKADGVNYKNLNNKDVYKGKVFTTRSNGSIFIRPRC